MDSTTLMVIAGGVALLVFLVFDARASHRDRAAFRAACEAMDALSRRVDAIDVLTRAVELDARPTAPHHRAEKSERPTVASGKARPETVQQARKRLRAEGVQVGHCGGAACAACACRCQCRPCLRAIGLSMMEQAEAQGQELRAPCDGLAHDGRCPRPSALCPDLFVPDKAKPEEDRDSAGERPTALGVGGGAEIAQAAPRTTVVPGPVSSRRRSA